MWAVNSDPELLLLFFRFSVWSPVCCSPMTLTPSSCKSRAPGSTQQLPPVRATRIHFLTTHAKHSLQDDNPFHCEQRVVCSALQMTEFKHSQDTCTSIKIAAGEQRGICAEVNGRADGKRGRWTVKWTGHSLIDATVRCEQARDFF